MKKIKLILICVTILQSPFLAFSADRCEALFFENRKSVNRAVSPNWMEHADRTIIKGYILTGGKMLVDAKNFKRNGYASTDYVISKDFFDKAQLAAPHNATEVNLATYGYYDSKKNYNFLSLKSRLQRGGGRDHVLLPKKEYSGNVNPAITEKGSGINLKYADANGSFVINNFRKNGLQEHTEVVSESTVVQQLQRVGVPIVHHPQSRLAPLEFQKIIGAVDQEGNIIGKLAAQTTRVQDMPRDSFNGVNQVTPAERYKLVASILINNVGHGGINPENMAKGMLNDPGHVTIGYPITSGVYRCVLCSGIRGSRADGTMVGIMDYYFPSKQIKSYDDYFDRHRKELASTQFRFNREIGDGLFLSISKELYGNKNPVKLSSSQLKSFEDLLRQKINVTYVHKNESLDFFYKVAQKLLLRETLTSSIFTGNDANYSARFLMQLGALKSLSNESNKEEVNHFIDRFGSLLEYIRKDDYYNLIDLFAQAYEKSEIKDQVTKKLFSEYLTLDMILADAQKAAPAGTPFELVENKLKNVIEQDSKPITWKPMDWMRAVNEAFSESFQP